MKKTVYILRGVPGSGKTFLANVLKDALGAEIFSADDYFEQDGEYRFDRSKLSEAHESCYNRFLDALDRNVEYIVIHNTAIRRWEYEDYVEKARMRGYEYVICDLKSSFKNVHDVPMDVIWNMRRHFEKN